MKSEIIYGIHPVFEALQAKKRTFYTLFIMKGKANARIERIRSIAETNGIAIQYLQRQKFQSLTGVDTHQGIAASVSLCPLTGLFELMNDLSATDSPGCFLMIDNIVDPHNLGALIRTAVCAQFFGVIISKDRSALPSPTVSKASAGALEHVRLTRVTNMISTINTLKKSGMWIIGLDRSGERSIYENDFTGNIVLVVGGEENGIRPLVKKHCDFLSFIPQSGPVGALNASVAGAVAMYEGYRQRLASR